MGKFDLCGPRDLPFRYETLIPASVPDALVR